MQKVFMVVQKQINTCLWFPYYPCFKGHGFRGSLLLFTAQIELVGSAILSNFKVRMPHLKHIEYR